MRKVALGMSLLLCLVLFHQASATVRHYTGRDGKSYTWYLIPISGELKGVPPEELDQFQILCNGKEVDLSLDEFMYLTVDSTWKGGSGVFEYLMLIVPGAPKLGEYVFTLRSGVTTVTYSDSQIRNKIFPSPDTATFRLRGNTFSWDPVSSATGPHYYRLEIQDPEYSTAGCSWLFPGASDRCTIAWPYSTGRVQGMTSHTVPDGFLTRGKTYHVRVSVFDAPESLAVQNRSGSDWAEITYGGSIPHVFVQHWKFESIADWDLDKTEFDRIMFSVTDEYGNPITSVDKLTDVTLYGPGLGVISLSHPLFESYKLRYGSYSGFLDLDDDFQYEPVFYADIPGGASSGDYLLEVTYNGAAFQKSYHYEGPLALPVISASSFELKEDGLGDLTWSWNVPDSFCTSSLSKNCSSRAAVEITRDGESMGWLFITVPPCLGEVTFPYELVKTLNDMGDQFKLWIQVRTTAYGNRTHSDKLALDYLGPTSPSPTKVEGMITDANSGEGIPGAQVAFRSHGPVLTTGIGGAFSSSEVLSGTYDVRISAPSYFAKVLPDVKLAPGAVHELSTSLNPMAPRLGALSASPSELANDGLSTTLLTARVSHPSGAGAISSVTTNLSPIGGKAVQLMYNDGTHGDATAGDGIYSYKTTASLATRARDYILKVAALDKNGFRDMGGIDLSVIEKATGKLAPALSATRVFTNALERQDLVISVRLNRLVTTSMFHIRAEECSVTLTIYRPDGSVYGAYNLTDSIDITIEDAEFGKWEYKTKNNCDTEVAYEIQTKGSGTGVLVGRVLDAFNGKGLTGALVRANTGGSTTSIEHGYFAGVAVAGSGAVIVELSEYKSHVRTGVAIQAGETTNLTVQLIPERSPAEPVPSGQNIYEIKYSKDTPSPPKQPVAVKTEGGNLEVSALFPPYESVVDLYAGVIIDAPGAEGGLYLFAPPGGPMEFSGLHPWVSGTRAEQSGLLWSAGDLSAMSPADYLFFSLVTPAGRGLADFDLSYYTVTLSQAPPSGMTLKQIKKPDASPVAGIQPLALKKAADGDPWELWAWFPPQEEPVHLYVGYIKPSEPEKIYLFSVGNEEKEFAGALTPWRKAVTRKQNDRIRSFSKAETEPGPYVFFSLRTTDPAGLTNFDLVYFVATLEEDETSP